MSRYEHILLTVSVDVSLRFIKSCTSFFYFQTLCDYFSDSFAHRFFAFLLSFDYILFSCRVLDYVC